MPILSVCMFCACKKEDTPPTNVGTTKPAYYQIVITGDKVVGKSIGFDIINKPTTASWDFGDSITASNAIQVSHTFYKARTYIVSMVPNGDSSKRKLAEINIHEK